MPVKLYDPKDILWEFKPKTWFPKVNGVEHFIKDLGTLMKSNTKVTFNTNAREYKKLVGKYEFTIVGYVQRQMQKNPSM